MLLFTKEGKAIKIDQNSKCGEGACGIIFKTSEDRCIKVFKYIEDAELEDIIKFIQKLDNPNIYKVYNIFYNRRGMLRGFERTFFDHNEVDLLTFPSDYIIDNYERLLQLADIFTEENIEMQDINSSNVSVGYKDISIMDAGLFCYAKIASLKQVDALNKRCIVSLFRELLYISYIKYHLHDNFNSSVLELSSEKNGGLSRTLSKYKYPIDYLK